MKALGAGLDAINPLDVEVSSPPDTVPVLQLHGTAAEAAAPYNWTPGRSA